MTPVITITFNPCVDKSFGIDVLVQDKKLRSTSPRLEPGGGGINVARVIHRPGGKVLAVYPSGGYHGSLLTEMLMVEGVETYPVMMLADIRENINISEATTGRQYRFMEPGSPLTEHSWTRCLDALTGLDTNGGIVVGLGRKMPLGEAVRFGVACGAATVMNPGTELRHRIDAEELYSQLTTNPNHVFLT
jgi:6-phosphofructokinase 2